VKNQIERRTWRNVEFRVSAPNEPATIGGYAAVFDSESEDLGYFCEVREEIDPHAFDSVIATNPDVRCFFNHDPNLVLGRTTAGTLRLSVDARGLVYDCDPPDTQFARDLMVSLRRKDITGSSFGFICKRDQWTDNPDGSVTRRILEFDQLFDVSPVTFPAFPAASSEARSLPASMPAEMRSKIEARLKKPEHRADPNDAGCSCDCPECQDDNNCAACSKTDCSDPECACQEQRSLRNADENRRMTIRLGLAS
jgi:HK97 family phage prohead protease